MGSRLVRAGSIGLVTLVALGFSQASAQAALPDAACVAAATAGATLGPNERGGQTFTAIHTGTLVRGDIAITKGSGSGDFQLQILNVDGSGIPVNGVLSSVTIPDASVPTGDSTLSGTFGSPPNVIAGQRYALVMTRLGGSSRVRGDIGDPCPGGEGVFSAGPSSSWSVLSMAHDIVFQVFVNPPNQFSVGKLKGRKLTLNVPGEGAIAISDATRAHGAIRAAGNKSLKSSQATASGPGNVTVTLRLTKGAKQRLRTKGKMTVRAAITYTPTGGEPNTVGRKLKLRKG